MTTAPSEWIKKAPLKLGLYEIAFDWNGQIKEIGQFLGEIKQNDKSGIVIAFSATNTNLIKEMPSWFELMAKHHLLWGKEVSNA